MLGIAPVLSAVPRPEGVDALTGWASIQCNNGFLRTTIKDRDMADALYHLGACLLGDGRDEGLALRAIGGIDPDFDQLMLRQREVYLGEDGTAQACATNDDNRFAVVRQTTQLTNVTGLEWHDM